MTDDDDDAPPYESRLPASIAVGVVVVVGLLLPEAISLGPTWLIPSLVAVVLIPLTLLAPRRHPDEEMAVRIASIGLSALVGLGNLASLVALVRAIVHGSPPLDAPTLLRAALVVWIWNMISMALILWELDRGGPQVRGTAHEGAADLLFPQMTLDADQLARIGATQWRPHFLDYLYVSATNTTAFSPTDTLPLTRRAKALMLVQSLVSLTALAFVAARAVNTLR